MLLQENSSQYDGNTECSGTEAQPFLFTQLGMGQGDMCAQGVIHMDARPQIGGSIGTVQRCHHLGEDIVTGHNRRP